MANADEDSLGPADVTEEEKKLSFEEKLALIDDEIQTIYHLCVKSGFTPYQIEKCAKPFVEPIKKDQRRRLINRLLAVGFVVSALFALFYYDHPVRKFVIAVGRVSAIQVLPYWDWSKHYNDQCLISNPYFRGEQLSDDVCENCDNLLSIDRISNADPHVVAEEYIYDRLPFIVTDALTDWPATKKFSLQFLNELYQTNEVLKTAKPCFVKSNIRLKPGQHRTLLEKSAAGKIDNWFMFWDNCELKPTKVFRQFCRRPYFMPNMVEMAHNNWVLAVKNITAKNYKPYFTENSLVVFAQIRGSTEIELQPMELCEAQCRELEFTLNEGETLVVNNLLYFLNFKPSAEDEAIVIASGANFDS